MNWLKNTVANASGGDAGARRKTLLDVVGSVPQKARTLDQTALCESFLKHCSQVAEIIDRTQDRRQGPSNDDLLAVQNHLNQLSTLLLLELKSEYRHSNAEEKRQQISAHGRSSASGDYAGDGHDAEHRGWCLEILLSENFLSDLLEWNRSLTGDHAVFLRKNAQ